MLFGCLVVCCLLGWLVGFGVDVEAGVDVDVDVVVVDDDDDDDVVDVVLVVLVDVVGWSFLEIAVDLKHQ